MSLALALAVGVFVCGWMLPRQIQVAEGGSLTCARDGDGQCHLVRGWLVHDTETFPVDDLLGGRVTWSARVTQSGLKAYRVEVLTREGTRPLAGWTQDGTTAHSTAAAIETFAEKPDVTSLAVKQPADTVRYAIAGALVAAYALVAAALAIGTWRKGRAAA